MHRLSRALLACFIAMVAAVPPGPALAAVAIPSDFNGDGYGDLAIGVPEEDFGPVRGTGAVNVLYGSVDGLTTTGAQLWHESVAGIPDADATGDSFGFAVAPADFDGDGYGDLAVSAPFEDLGALGNAGQVVVLHGSSGGLTADRSQRWTQDSPIVAGTAEPRDQFGYSLAAGDFDGDGYGDLAIGVQRENLGARNAGAVQVLYGSADGLAADRNQLWGQDSPGVPEDAELKDQFGNALAAGDFDGDGASELAVATMREDLGGVTGAGAVTVLPGSPVGLVATGARLWTQDSPGIRNEAEPGDGFGRVLATGRFDGDPTDDLAIGVPLEDLDSVPDAGGVQVLYGSPSGLTDDGNRLWTQDSLGVPDSAGAGDQFGKAIAVGDLDGDGFADLAAGVRYDDPGGVIDAGIVNVLYGARAGLRAARAQLWTQAMPDAPDAIESPDHFGSCLAAADLGKGTPADLVVGSHFETVDDATSAGSLHVLYGAADGLAATGSQLWTQDSPGVPEDSDPYDFFPAALSAAGSGRCG